MQDPNGRHEAPAAAMADLAYRITDFRALADAARRTGDAASWQQVLDFASFWNMRNDPSESSVEFMSDEELQQALVEDLLQAACEAAHGAMGAYTLHQAIRFLKSRGEHQNSVARRRVEDAILELADRGLVVLHAGSDRLSLCPSRMREAEDFAGYYPDFGGCRGDDIIDRAMAAGGPEMVADLMTDLGVKLSVVLPT